MNKCENVTRSKAGATFDNSFFDNCFDLVQQLNNRLFLEPFSVHKKSKLALVELNQDNNYCMRPKNLDFFFNCLSNKITRKPKVF